MVEAAPKVNKQYISLIDELEPANIHELRYWLCIQLAMQWRMVGDPSLIDWLDVAQRMAEMLADETLCNMVIGMRVWGYLASGRPVGSRGETHQTPALFRDPLSRQLHAVWHSAFIEYGLRGERTVNEKAINYGTRAINLACAGEICFGSARRMKVLCSYTSVSANSKKPALCIGYC